MPNTLRHRRWVGTNQPQLLQFAVVLLYWNAALSLIFGLVSGGFGRLSLLLVVANVAGGFGVANEAKWGYYLAVTAALLPLALIFVAGFGVAGGVLNLLFRLALVALLLHPISRHYVKVWFH